VAKATEAGISLWGIDRYWIVCPQATGQIKIGSASGMVKALRQWLESHELPAIIAGVLGVIIMLSVLLVVGGYLLVAR
jgi:hypothetical protein